MKKLIQGKIDSGEISNYSELSELVESLNLEITRNGPNYLGLKPETGKRFRVRFSFPNPTRKGSPIKLRIQDSKSDTKFCRSETGCWIYALLAYNKSRTKKACYIGQTVNLRRRFREHYKNSRIGRGSYYLFEWAKLEGAEVRGAVLSWTNEDQRTSTQMEGHWLQLAIRSGFEAPGLENWGQLPSELSQKWGPETWQEKEIDSLSMPLFEIVDSGSLPVMLIGEYNF